MNVFELLAVLALNKKQYEDGLSEAQNEGESFGSKLSGTLGKAVKVIETAAAAGAAAVAAVTKNAVTEYADYEQLVGGVETLFKESAPKVIAYAEQAYQTAGVSANEYMETVTSFSASLLQSLGGDTEAAAEYADMALTDMSDNANKMGSSMESIQIAYQGFAKQNYTMLDNLKLGYGGTQSEMQRLIEDAEKLDTTFIASRDTNGELTMSYSDIVDAIHIVQTNMGITGTTAKEAASTVSGSISTMKASWKNFLTGLGNSKADIYDLVDQLVDSAETALNNILPVIENVLESLVDALPATLNRLLPLFISTITNMLPSFIQAVSGLIQGVATQLPKMVGMITQQLPSMLEQVISSAGDILGDLIPGLFESVGNIILNAPAMLVGAVDGFISGFGSMFEGIADAVDNAMSPRFSSDSAFSNTIAAFQTNAEYAFSRASNNLEAAWARIIGNTEWSTALDNLSLAQDAFDAVVAEYDEYKKKISDYSPEAAVMDYEVKAGTVTALMDQISQLVDGNGNVISGNESLVEALIGQVNDLLGEEVLSVTEPTMVTAIVETIDAANESGTDPYKAVEEMLLKNYSSIFGSGIPIDGVITELSTSWLMSDRTQDPAEYVRAELSKRGWDQQDIDTICDLIAHDGEVNTAFTTWGVQGATEKVLRDKLGIMEEEDIHTMVQIIVDGTTDGKSVEEIAEEISENFGPEAAELYKTEIAVQVDGLEDIDEAINKMKEYTVQLYANKTAELAVDQSIASKKEYAEMYGEYTDAMTEYYRLLEAGETRAAEKALETAITHRDSLEGISQTAQATADDYILAMYNLQNSNGEVAKSIEEVPQAFKDNYAGVIETMTGFSSTMSEVDDELAGISLSMIEQAGGIENAWNNLDGAQKALYESAVASASSFAEAGELLGTNADNVEALYSQMGTYLETFTNGVNDSTDQIASWIGITPEVQALVESLGLSTEDAARIFLLLSENEALAANSTKALGDTIEGESGTVTVYADEFDAAGGVIEESITAAADEVDSAVEQMETSLSENDVAENAAATGEDAADGFSDLPTDLDNYSAEAMEAVVSEFKGYQYTISETAYKVARFVSNAWEALGSKLESTTEDFMAAVGVALRTSAVQTTMKYVADAVYNIYNNKDWVSLGTNTGAGVVSGLNSYYWKVWNAASNLAQAANSAYRSTLSIHSPSRVMEENARYTVEGLAQGLEENAYLVDEAMENVADFGGLDDINASAVIAVSAENNSIDAKLNQIIDVLSNLGIYLDGDVLVGQTVSRINDKLNEVRTSTLRGGVYA